MGSDVEVRRFSRWQVEDLMLYETQQDKGSGVITRSWGDSACRGHWELGSGSVANRRA